MNGDVEELKKKVAELEERLTALEMRGAASVTEGLGALKAELKQDIERLENWIKNMRH